MTVIVYSTVDNIRNAKKIANVIVKERLVACVNIIPKIESIYWWKGKIENSKECILIAKTKEKNIKKTMDKIRSIHPYELPDIVVIPVVDGFKKYIDYIDDETI